MKSPVLYFFLLVFKILFDLFPNVVYKHNRFLKVFLDKNFEFVLCIETGPIAFKSSLILISIKVNFFLKTQGCKEDTFIFFNPNSFEIVFTL